MKILTLILLFLLLLPVKGQVPKMELGNKGMITGQSSDGLEDPSEDSNIFNPDPDILAIRPQQRFLPPLSGKDKVKWSFKMAKRNIFL